jgi:hypothetical protein
MARERTSSSPKTAEYRHCEETLVRPDVVKVIDKRGNELMVVKSLREAS